MFANANLTLSMSFKISDALCNKEFLSLWLDLMTLSCVWHSSSLTSYLSCAVTFESNNYFLAFFATFFFNFTNTTKMVSDNCRFCVITSTFFSISFCDSFSGRNTFLT